MTEAFATAVLTAVLTGVPIIITSITGLVIAVRSTNKKTVDSAQGTNKLVVDHTTANSEKIDEVTKTVNGNHTVMADELAATRKENIELREQLARLGSMRSIDRSGDDHG